MSCLLLLLSRDTAANDDSMAAVLFANLLSQLDRVRSQEQNFLQRHNMKIIQHQLQVCQPQPQPQPGTVFRRISGLETKMKLCNSENSVSKV